MRADRTQGEAVSRGDDPTRAPGRRAPLAGSTAAPRHPHTYARPRLSLLYVLRRTFHRLLEIQVWDIAAAMTFFGAVSLLPIGVSLLSLVSLLGVEAATVDTAAGLASELWPSLPEDTVRAWILSLHAAEAGGVAVVLGLLGAVFSASGAVAAFHRAMHRIHDTREGRLLPQFRLVVFVETLALMAGLVLIVVLVILGGDLAERLGRLVGLSSQAVQAWDLAKWPAILALLALVVTLAYRFGPNVRPPRYRPFSAGAVMAVLLLFLATLALGWISANLGQFALVGRINSVIGVLGLVWAACMVLVAGAAYDAEKLRARQIAVGVDASAEIQLATRYTRVLELAEEQEQRDRALAALACAAVRTGEELTVERTPLLAEAGTLFAVDAPRLRAADLTSGRPFHAAPAPEAARLGKDVVPVAPTPPPSEPGRP